MAAFDETLQDALSTVRLIPRWQLTAEAWSEVAAALARVDDAVSHGDRRALGGALEELERYGPTRLVSIPRTGGTDGREPPPRQILDIVNTLVHPAQGWAAHSAPETQRGPETAR
ncbi:MAG: hypothetical protein H0V04_02170 [Chloroflexi bacterium]|nr:hypothetical protein [Chloroflexota bacterium]HEV8053524.1 CATRA system-associated protein [Candidatus Limnocylindrales bacterium]